MATTWIIAADAGRARIFADSDAAQPPQEIKDMVSPAAFLHIAEINTDKLDPVASGKSIHGSGAAAPNKQYQPQQTPDDHAAVAFARDLVHFLQQAHQEGRFQQLALTAEPRFLGQVRAELTPQLRQLLSVTIDKDLTQASAAELRQQVKAQLRPA